MDKIQIRYFVDGKEYANRSTAFVPRVGDEVKLSDDVVYAIVRVVWIENGRPAHVAIDIEKVEVN